MKRPRDGSAKMNRDLYSYNFNNSKFMIDERPVIKINGDTIADIDEFLSKPDYSIGNSKRSISKRGISANT